MKNLTPDELAIHAHAQKYEGYDNIGVRRAELLKLLADLDAARGAVAPREFSFEQLEAWVNEVEVHPERSRYIFTHLRARICQQAALAAKGTVGT